MLDFLFKKKEETSFCIDDIYAKLKELYGYDNIPEGRKEYLSKLMKKYGYLPYPHIKALEELTNAEILFALETKWKNNGVLNDKGEFIFDNPSVLARNNVQNSEWIQKEGHNIKLINLAGLGNGNEVSEPGKFMNWLCQLLILPTGNLKNKIFNTTIYLIPFHPREFGCAYLPTSSEVSPHLEDKEIRKATGLNVSQQLKLFITLAQLAGHPVIYDILPQTGRYSKMVLANPSIARWFDITALLKNLEARIDDIALELATKYDKKDVEIVRKLCKKELNSSCGELSKKHKEIMNEFQAKLLEFKNIYSNVMLQKQNQKRLHKTVKKIVAKINDTSYKKDLTENDIIKQRETVTELISKGLWPAPGGAWCSAGIPIFDKMSECGSYPMFKHFNYKGEDVTHFANLDCQTPFYFISLEDGSFNQPVIDHFLDYMENLQAEYNFDGFRVDHIDHIVDAVSEENGIPISYRAPRVVLGELNQRLRNKIPYYASLAEYMLWDNFHKEYHQDMNFDLLWGNDIVCQSDKTPEHIVDDNTYLSNYNKKHKLKRHLSVLKTYNNQDGEFEAIDRYPGQLGEQGALFKWAKYKLLPGGKYAQRPVMYVDGDESFTATGIESVIGAEISMPREKNYDFFNMFDAIDRFAKNCDTITKGEAHIIRQDNDGFCVWQISKSIARQMLIVVANYNSPTEKFCVDDGNGNSYTELREGTEVFDKVLDLPCDSAIISEYKFNGTDIVECKYEKPLTSIIIGKLMPAEFKIFKMKKINK